MSSPVGVARPGRWGAGVSAPAPHRRGSALVPGLLLAAALLAALCWRRGPTGTSPRASRLGGVEVNRSTPSCRAAALGSQPSKDELAALGRPLPSYMLKAEDGSESNALRRWAETLQWRCDIGDQDLVRRPHPMLELIATHYPTFLHNPDREGRLTHWELVGRMNQKALWGEGLTPDDLVDHVVWSAIYNSDVVVQDDDAQITIIIDMAGFSMSKLTSANLGLCLRIVQLTGKHFPCRESGTYFINAPSFIERVHRMLAPFVSEKQRERVKIVSPEATPDFLRGLFAPENLPQEYGGSGPPLGRSELELEKRRLAATGSA